VRPSPKSPLIAHRRWLPKLYAGNLSFGQSLATVVKEVGDGVVFGCVSAGDGWLRASMATFSFPGVCLMLEVNSAMIDNCRCWQADQGGVVRNRAMTRGLWSVRRQKRPPSSRDLKCRTALKAASSSLSKVEYWVPAPYSFLE
jgi:hypothetical protein